MSCICTLSWYVYLWFVRSESIQNRQCKHFCLDVMCAIFEETGSWHHCKYSSFTERKTKALLIFLYQGSMSEHWAIVYYFFLHFNLFFFSERYSLLRVCKRWFIGALPYGFFVILTFVSVCWLSFRSWTMIFQELKLLKAYVSKSWGIWYSSGFSLLTTQIGWIMQAWHLGMQVSIT